MFVVVNENKEIVLGPQPEVVEGYDWVPYEDAVKHYPDIEGYTKTRLTKIENSKFVVYYDYVPVDYIQRRQREYPLIGDQLDALWKIIQANKDKIALGEAVSLLNTIQEVKNRHPKE